MAVGLCIVMNSASKRHQLETRKSQGSKRDTSGKTYPNKNLVVLMVIKNHSVISIISRRLLYHFKRKHWIAYS